MSPISSDDYRFSDHPAYLAAYRAGIARVAALDCDILLTPHPSASQMVDRLAGRAPLENPNACRDYAAALSKRLDDRLAKEAASRPRSKP
jgi:metallo-beta-lactamase class B